MPAAHQEKTTAQRLLRAAQVLTTPLLPDDYLTYLNPLWSTREPRGRVVAVKPETKDAATLVIQTGPDWPAHTAGQYVRIGVDIAGVRHWRTYSLTSVPGAKQLEICVKAIPDGFVSQHLVHRTKPGTIVRLAPPAGEFVLPTELPQRLLFITAGSGITPVIGMLRDLEHRNEHLDIVHVHLAPSANDVIFAKQLSAQTILHLDDRDGPFNPQSLKRYADRPAWACGPAGLLDAVQAELPHVQIERFKPVIAEHDGAGGTVTFTASNKTVDADGQTPLLVAGEQAGALLPNGCRMGICHTCVGRLQSGAVRDLRTGERHDTEGELVRTCVSAACGPVSIDL